MRIIAIANQKGGVGKTTTSVNLGACLAAQGARVTVLDLDPQANTTSALDLVPGENPSIYDSLIEGADVATLVRATKYDNLSIIPCDLQLAGCEIELARAEDHLTRLRGILHAYRETVDTDYMLIDCPPSLGILMTSALAAADELLIPLQCEYFGLVGLSEIVKVLEMVATSGANPDVEIEGIVMTMADSRTNLTQQVIDEVQRVFKETVYKTIIPRSIALGESPSHGRTIIDYKPASAGAIAYTALAKEFLARHAPQVAS
ncbi:MAG: ParA family protein [Verrucomicrobiales bacterium]|nr:ParA family protein [Verrucomicrobiales bacterium]